MQLRSNTVVPGKEVDIRTFTVSLLGVAALATILLFKPKRPEGHELARWQEQQDKELLLERLRVLGF